MTLREFLGGDVQRVHDGVDALLNRDDGLLCCSTAPDGKLHKRVRSFTVPTRAIERGA